MGLKWLSLRMLFWVALAATTVQVAAQEQGVKPEPLLQGRGHMPIQAGDSKGQEQLLAPERRAYCTDTGDMLISGRWCATSVRAFKDRDLVGRRFLLMPDNPRRSTGQKYMVWHDCGTASFRVLARLPSYLPATKRWMELRAKDGDERAKGLLNIGKWACALEFGSH